MTGKPKRLLVLCLAVLASMQLVGQALFDIERLYADTPYLQSRLPLVVEAALQAVSERYVRMYTTNKTAKSAGRLTVMLLRDSGMAILKAVRADGREEQVIVNWTEEAELTDVFPPVLFSLWARLQGLADTWRQAPPKPSAELSLHALAPLLALQHQVPQTTASLAPAVGGGVFVAGIGFVARLGDDLRLRGSWLPDSTEPYMYLFQMSTAANGTLHALSSTGQSWSLSRGADGFERGPAIQPLPASIAASAQGELVYFDYNAGSLIRISGRRRTPFRLAGAVPQFVMAFAYDSDSNFWIFDQTSGMVKCYSAEGALLQAIRLLAGPDTPPSWQRMHLRGSDIVMSGPQGIAAWDQHGLPLWKLNSFSPQADPLVNSAIVSTTVDSLGALYVLSSGGLSITRYDDERSLAMLDPDTASQLRKLTDLNQRVLADPEDELSYSQRLEAIQGLDHDAMELTFRSAMRDAFPSNKTNIQRLTELQLVHSRKRLLAETERVYIPLRDFGVESARLAFSSVMQNFERYLAQNPQDSEVRQAMLTLQETFRRRELNPVWQPPQPLLLEASLEAVFPAFMARYRQVPLGVLKIGNPGPQRLSDLRVEFYIKDFMDYPAVLTYPLGIKSGETVELPVHLLFNRSILELSETTVIMAAIEASAKAGDTEAVGRLRYEVEIMARSALTWEDSAALAAFITPNDDAIVNFTHAAVSAGAPPLFGRPFSRAFAIVNALGARGLAYVEDPRTPFSEVSGSAQIDTVRFPRQTLFSGAGDCDDTTALLASCLEAAGVATAIITTPGHVLLAFAAESSPHGAGRYQSTVYGALEYEGDFWIPLETTVLSRGFSEAWRLGWQEVQRAGSSLEIIPLKAARRDYPVLSLPATPALPPLPGEAAYTRLAALSLEHLGGHWLKPLEQAVELAPLGRSRAIALNDLAVRQTQFGKLGDAIASLQTAVVNDSGYRAAQVNLTVLQRVSEPGASSAAGLVDASTGNTVPSGSTRASQVQADPSLLWAGDE